MTDRELAVAAALEFSETTDPYSTWVKKGRPPTHWAAGFSLLDKIGVPPPVPAGWTLAFAEEFDGPLDPAKWNVRDGSTTHNQLATYRAKNAIVANGVLTMRATQDSAGAYSSAYIDTIGKQSWQYGRFEMRAKMPQAQGMWPAFWLRGNQGLGEVDIIECVGGLPQMTVQTIHSDTNGPPTDVKKGNDFELMVGTTIYDWHTYTFERTPGSAKWYEDGQLVMALTPTTYPPLEQVFTEPMNIRLNLQVGGSTPSAMPNWYGKPVVGAPQGLSDFVVDYVRVYAAL